MSVVSTSKRQAIRTVSVLPGILQSSPFEFLRDAAQQHDDLVRIQAGPQAAYLVSNPDYFQYILRDNQANFAKSQKLYDAAKMMVGDGLLTSTGDFWLRQRRMIQPYFHRKQVAEFTSRMAAAVDGVLTSWEPTLDGQTSVDLKDRMSQVTIEVISRTMFGENVVTTDEMDQVSQDLIFLADYIAFRGYMPFIPLAFPMPGHNRYKRAMERLYEIVSRIIELGRNNQTESGTLVSMLVHTTDEETNEQMTVSQLFDETMTIFSAGFETTATALTWLFYLLDQHPQIKQDIQDEVDRVLGNRIPTFEDVRELTYTRMAFQEAMRYYPPSPLIPRTAQADDQLGDYQIPAGSMLLMFIYGLHHNSAHWQAPEQFDPTRFTPETTAGRSRFAYLPFSTGPRQCVGSEFAMVEGVLAAAMLMQRYNIDLVPNQQIKPNLSATLTPKPGVQVRISKRQ